ncbi:MAG: iron-containing redox enzyme family protein [Acidimicrobiales bacterium]
MVVDALQSPAHDLGVAPRIESIWTGDDLQLALYLCYELHYRSFAGIDDRWEWEPSLLALRRRLEECFEQGLRDLVGPQQWTADVADRLWEMIAEASGPSLSTFVAERATYDQLRGFLVHRSAYQLKEADPHTWAIPRLTGEAKAALVHIQADEYGNGVEADMHSSLFADTLDAVGLDSTYGAYLDWLPAPTLATVNLVSFFGLHRRWRGALVGHLAVFEMTSVGPMGRYAAALKRLGVGASGRRFYEVHVEADAEHQFVAADRLAAGLARTDRDLVGDILFGAATVMAVEARFTRHLLDQWGSGRTSLRHPLPEPALGP